VSGAKVAALAALFWTLAGCTLQPTSVAVADRAMGEQAREAAAPPSSRGAASEAELPPRDLWDRLRRQLHLHTLDNAEIAAARRHYRGQPRFVELVTPRAERYLYFIVEEVEARGLPGDLALLPLVESALNPFAYSPQRAAGLWQIMPGTADDLSMRRDWWFDARLDVRASTHAALDYLTVLHDDFEGDWLLALAAYNSGKARVRRAIRQNRLEGRPTDFWSLDLPRETLSYVPRLIALSSLVASGDDAFPLPAIPNEPAFAAVRTGGQIEMLRVAQLAGMELDELRRLNPGQRRWATAPESDGALLLPVAVAAEVEAKIAALPAGERVTWQRYRIRRGDSLIRIARRFDTSVERLRGVNGLTGNLIRAGDTLMIPNSAAWQASLAARGSAEALRGTPQGYTVRRGDSLYTIARRFDVSIDDIIIWNDLDPGRYLQPGQALTLFLGN
jgi:membrane-bound lytic murein transglycosylase D